MSELMYRRFGLWPGVFVTLVSSGAVASLVAIITGTAPARMNALAPFGLCAGLNVFCGMAIANGALVVLAISHLILLPGWMQVRRVSLVLAVSGYAVTMLGLMTGFPLPHSGWPAIFRVWHPASLLDGAFWTAVLMCLLGFLEFTPIRLPRVAGTRWFSTARRLEMSLVILAVIATTLQQTALSREAVAAEARISPLWTGPDLSVMFFLSSFCGALALLLFALRRGSIAFQRRVPAQVMAQLARVLGVALFIYLALRITGLLQRGLASVMFAPSKDSALFLLEIAAFVLGMMWLGAGETNPETIQTGAVMVICGTMLNRLNTSITALEGTAGPYRPHWVEIFMTISLVAVGVAMFGFCAKHLPIFVERTEGV